MTGIKAAFSKVSREAFIPALIWVRQDDGWAVPVHRDKDPERWWQEVSSGEAIITQVDDGAEGKGIWPTSSCPAPGITFEMLNHLDLQPGHAVLEIGTGTGWNAALIAEITGPQRVTTIEVDAQIARQARHNLTRTQSPVQVITGDGEKGYPPGAPYDRIIATAAVATLPFEWVRQTKPGGRIVAPWAATFHPGMPLAVLTKGSDGTAQGHFLDTSAFMPLRGQRISQASRRDMEEQWRQAGQPPAGRFSLTVTPCGQTITATPGLAGFPRHTPRA